MNENGTGSILENKTYLCFFLIFENHLIDNADVSLTSNLFKTSKMFCLLGVMLPLVSSEFVLSLFLEQNHKTKQNLALSLCLLSITITF